MASDPETILDNISSDNTVVPYDLVAATVETLRPAVQQDGGDLELVKIEGLRVFIKLSGACTTCTLAGQTLGGVRRKLVEVLGIPVRVVPAN